MRRELWIVVTALLLAACHHDESTPEAALPRPRVAVQAASRGPAEQRVTLTGLLTAAPGRDVKLGALVPGRLASLKVAEGDSVKSGQRLGEIELGPANDELTQAQATADEADAALKAAQARSARTEELLHKGIAAAQEAEQARADAVAAQSAKDRARAALDTARRKVSRSALVAPFDGVVVAVLVHAGESVDGNGQPVVEVAAPNPVELRCAVPARDAAMLRPGMPATIASEGVSGRRAEVIAVSPSADPSSGNVTVRVRADNADGALRLGLLGHADVVVETIASAVSLPSSALLPAPDGGAEVAVVQGDKAHLVDVQVAFDDGHRAAVRAGLDGGEQVVVEGGYALPEGAPVELAK